MLAKKARKSNRNQAIVACPIDSCHKTAQAEEINELKQRKIDICTSCTKPKCKGSCELISKNYKVGKRGRKPKSTRI